MATRHILFAGNPWPKGHAVKRVTFAAHLHPGGGLFLDLDLMTADYDAGDRPRGDDDDEDEDVGDWRSKIVWENYGRCSLSSTKWGHRGVLAGTSRKKFDLEALDGRVLRADTTVPGDSEERAFGIYLLGHDGVAKHVLRFARTRHGWNLDWRARVALEYAGSTTFRHRLHATLEGVPFAGIDVPRDVTSKEARAMLTACVADPGRWRLTGGKRRRFVRGA